MSITFNINSKSKKKIREWRYLQGGPRYRNWMILVSWVWRSVKRRSHRKVFFSVSGIFSGKVESGVVRRKRQGRFSSSLGSCENMQVRYLMYCKPTKFDQFRWSHFLENRNFIFFFLCELPLILRVGRKLKNGLEIICKRALDIEFEQDCPVGGRHYVRRR